MLSATAKVLFTTALRSVSSSSSSSSSASLPVRRRSTNASTRFSLHHFPRHFTIDRDLTADPPVSLAATTQPARTAGMTKDDDGGSEGRPQAAAAAVIQEADAEVATLVPVEASEQKDDDVKKEAPFSGIESFSPNRVNSTALFHAFVDARAWNAAVSVIRSTECDINPSAIEPFIRVLSKNRAFGELLEVISVVKDTIGIIPSIPTWNSALWGSLRAGRTDLVWMLYNIMDGYGACGNVFTIECLVQAFCKEKRLLEAFSFLRQVSRAGLIPNVISFNKLVYGFCKEGDFRKVSDVLHLMIAIGQYPNISTYQAIIHQLCVRRRVDEAFQIFDRLKRVGYAPDVITYTTIINGLCKGRRMADAQKLWQEMTVLGIEPNRCTYNTLLDGYFKTGNLCEAQNLYNEMLKKGHKESTVTCNTLIAGLCQNGRTSEALNVFEEMKVKCIKHDVITYNTLIQGFCNDGKTVEARNFFKQLLESRLQPSERSYSHLICALSKEGSVHEAAELFSDLESRGLKASNVLHEYMISGFCNVDDVGQGMVWLWKMLNSDLQPSEVTFNEFIGHLTLANRVDDAFLVLKLMLHFGYSPNRWICGLLIHRLCRMKCGVARNHLVEIIAGA